MTIPLKVLRREIAAFVLGTVLGLPVDRRILRDFELSPIFQDVVREEGPDGTMQVTSARLVGWNITRKD